MREDHIFDDCASKIQEPVDECLICISLKCGKLQTNLKNMKIDSGDTGLFTLSPPSPWQGSFQMGAYLGYYGPGRDSASFSDPSARKAACRGYVVTVLNIVEVFGAVLSRYCYDIPSM